jgi:hypothetical protein
VDYPTNEVNFTLQFDVKHEAGHYLKLRYDWISATADGYEISNNETAPFKEWTLLQIEGEEPAPIQQEPVVDPKTASPAKKGAAPPKKVVVEEVIDNRPRTIQLKRDFASEEARFRFTEPAALKFKSHVLTVHIIENEQSIEKVQISLSELLWA